MKKRALGVQLFAVLISIVMALPATIVAAAVAPSSQIKVVHKKPGEKYIPGFRINLDATITAATSLLATRCYFKSKNDKNFAFVDMFHQGGKNYKATLPAPFVNSEAVNYLFVVVDKNKQVSRTAVYTIEEGETKEAANWKDIDDVKEVRLDKVQDAAEKYVALFEKSKGSYSPASYQKGMSKAALQVKTELAEQQVPLQGFVDSATISEVPASAKFGLLAEGLYSADAIVSAGGTSALGGTSAGMATASAGGISTPAMLGIAAVVVGGAAVASNSGSSGGGDDSGATQTPPSTTPTPPNAQPLDATTILGAWNYTGNRPDGVGRSGTMNFSSGGTFTYTLVDADHQSDGSGSGSWSLSGSTITLDAALTGTGTVSGDADSFSYSGHGTFTFTR